MLERPLNVGVTVMAKSERELFFNWLERGINKGWITQPFCTTHDGDPYMTMEEELAWEQGDDPCCHVTKLKWSNR